MQEHNTPAYIQRADELARLRNALLARDKGDTTAQRAVLTPSSRGRSHGRNLLLVAGEMGSGKTRLAEEMSREAALRGWQVAWSQGHRQERELSYGPWREALRELFA